jgi:hypothetical protein
MHSVATDMYGTPKINENFLSTQFFHEYFHNTEIW